MAHPDPSVCRLCDKVFLWNDAVLHDDNLTQDERLKGSAYWLLKWHMEADHAGAMFVCPLQRESMSGNALTPQAFWEKDNSCSYCGSMEPETFLKCIADGCEVGPTDKSYKAYINVPNANVGEPCIIGSRSEPAFDRHGTPLFDDLTAEEIKTRYRRTPIPGTVSPTDQRKFYFQHFDEAQQNRFIDYVNNKTMKIGYPGHFYVLPYFCTRKAQ